MSHIVISTENTVVSGCSGEIWSQKENHNRQQPDVSAALDMTKRKNRFPAQVVRDIKFYGVVL